MQFTGIHINFFDRIKIDIGTFSARNGAQVSSGSPCGIIEHGRMIEDARSQVAPVIPPSYLLTYDASGQPYVLLPAKGILLDCYV